MSAALVVFAKIPASGLVKTRLTPELDDDEAAALYQAFLQDALDVYVDLGHDVRLYLAPSETALDTRLIPDGIALFKQRGEGLGDRMAHAFEETFEAGYERVAIVGTDHPTLPPSFIEQAFDSLSSSQSIAIGPAEDGGYYLLAMNAFLPQLFRGMEFSHSDVFAQTLERSVACATEVTVLPAWYDVDTPADLDRLRTDLAERGDLAPRTKRVLVRLSASRNGHA